MRQITFRHLALALLFASTLMGCGRSETGEVEHDLTPIENAAVSGCFKEHYQDPNTSDYVLPYAIGETFLVSQGNCGKYITHKPECRVLSANGEEISCGDLRYSYDFNMPIGTTIVASREGKVIKAIEIFSDETKTAEETNILSILHQDGTVSSYLHISENGISVELGEQVIQGQPIAISGNSGFTLDFPHLHFHVLSPPFEACDDGIYYGCQTIPVTFRNAYPLNGPLIEGLPYEAKAH